VADKTTTTTTPSTRAAIVGGMAALIGVVAAWLVSGGKVPALTEKPADVVAFGAWLIMFGLVLTIVAWVVMLASVAGAAMAKTVKESTDAAGVTTVGPADLAKDLISQSAELVKTPAGIGAFTMLVGAILVIGVIFAGPDETSTTDTGQNQPTQSQPAAPAAS
jgi:hypothetical protein